MAKLVIHQSVYNQVNLLCAEGDVVLGFLDKASGHPVRCPERITEIIHEGLSKEAK